MKKKEETRNEDCRKAENEGTRNKGPRRRKKVERDSVIKREGEKNEQGRRKER